MFPKRRKLNDNGFVKSSKTLIGSKIGVGSTYLPKYSKPFFLRPAQKYVIDVRSARATVVLISFVGAPSSPCGSSISFHGISAPDQFDTKINKNN